MNPQKQLLFKELLEKLEKSTFEPSDIKLLFLELRDHNKGSIIFEIANFIAHPEGRNKGVSFQYIERQYVKYNVFYHKDNILYDSITYNTFNKILLPGIIEFKEKDFKKSIGISRAQALNLLKKSYSNDKNFRAYFPSKLEKLEDFFLLKKIINFTVNSFVANPAINSIEVFKSLKSAISELNSKLNLGYNGHKLVNKNINDIYICIVHLLHYAEFEMWDNKIAKLRMSIKNKEQNQNNPFLHLFMEIPYNEKKVWFSWDFIYSECNLSKHIEKEQLHLFNKDIKIETASLYRNEQGILKIKVIDYKES
ncbi:hypothetical protein [Cyclobacterium lianum]|nr:hypothetical protein [Cyclobacterium lianum]